MRERVIQTPIKSSFYFKFLKRSKAKNNFHSTILRCFCIPNFAYVQKTWQNKYEINSLATRTNYFYLKDNLFFRCLKSSVLAVNLFFVHNFDYTRTS